MNLPFLLNNPESEAPESSRKRKRRKTAIDDLNETVRSETRWRTEGEQRIYSSKLFDALRHVRQRIAADKSSTRGRDVREAADRVLAVAAKGKTRWSRAILRSSRLRIRLKKVKRQKITGNRLLKTDSPMEKRLPILHRKLHTLGRLVPGCRKLPFPKILEEATDYIAALEMQVRAMAAIAELLTGSAGGLSASSDRLGSSLASSSS